MIELRVTEKFKDRVLNIALVASLLLFVFGVDKPENFQVAEPQQSDGLVVARLTPLEESSYAPIEPLQPVATTLQPITNQAVAIKTASSSSIETAQAPAPTAIDTGVNVQRRPATKSLSLPETLSSVLGSTEIKLF